MAGICKLILISDGGRREIELPRSNTSIRVGNTSRCELRVAQAHREPVEMTVVGCDGAWTLEKADNIYVTEEGVRYPLPKVLNDGKRLDVWLPDTNEAVFQIGFSLDVDSTRARYDRVIDIRNVMKVLIGGIPTANLYIRDELLGQDHLILFQRHGKMILSSDGAKCGVYINGILASGEQELRDTDFFSLMGYNFYYKNGCLYTDSRDNIRLQGLRSILSGVHSGDTEYPKFVRSVRKKVILSKEPITVLDPPQKPQKPKGNIFLQLLPAVGSILLVVLLRGVMGGGGSFVIFSACSMGLGVVTSLITYIAGNKDYKKEIEEREKEYSDYIKRKRREIEKARHLEVEQLNQIYCGPKTELQRIRDFSGDLFDRQNGDEDYLRILLGVGEKPAVRPIKITEKESITVSDEMFKIPRQIMEEYRRIPNAPVCLNAMDDNAIGVVGDKERLLEMLKLMSLDLASRHYYTDLKLVYIVGQQDVERVPWVRWLPHVKNDVLGARNIVCDEDSKNAMFEFLYVEMSSREQQKRAWPHYVVFMLADYGIKSHPVSKYIRRARELGFTFILMEGREELLSQECDEVVTLERASNRGTVYKTSNLNDVSRFTCTPVRDSEMWNAAVTLAPIYSEEVSLESALTKSLTFYEMLGISSCNEINLEKNWSSAAVDRSLAAPLGINSKREIVYLDLHERAHGPHGLVAGTTGSGKSEILQSYILSMAVRFHPYEVGFVIIDFKGGGMANQFKDLPHLVGAITNIDGAAIQRSLKSIKAELQKRQRLFAEANVNKIDDYIKQYKSGSVSVPMPHLIIVVDEFAELKAQQPEFMDELISAARIGRSLGVHLILATQKPSGQVNEQIWSNSRFQLCLKVATPQDSNEVIKSPLAAEIREPGRAYLRVGNDEIFELFQSGYSGGSAAAEADERKSYAVCEVSFTGKRTTVFEQKKREGSGSSRTQLDVITDYVHDYCERAGIKKLPDICLPDIPEVVEYQLKDLKLSKESVVTVVGTYDDPDMQYQGPVIIDHASENMIVIGSPQKGKTNLLQVIIRSLAERYSPEEVSIYIIDFGSMILRNYDEMAHVGGVVCSMEDEKLKNLFKLLSEEMEKRKERMMEIGVSSFTSYKVAGYKDLPQIVLLVDNYTALKELYFQDEDMLLPILRDGISVGISVVLANSQTSGISFKYMANFSREMALFCNDSSEYTSVMGSRPPIVPRPSAGRAIINIGNGVYEMQSYLCFAGEVEIERVNKMHAFVKQINERYPDHKARKIPVVPKVLDEHCLQEQFGVDRRKTYTVPIGLCYDPVAVLTVDLQRTQVLSFMGGSEQNRQNLLRVFTGQMEQNLFSCPVEAFVVDNIQHSLRWMEPLGITKEYTANANGIIDLLEIICDRVKNRFDSVVDSGMEALKNESLLLLVVQNRDALSVLSKNANSMKAYKELLSTYSAMKFCILYTDLEDATVSFSAPEVLKMIKENRNIIYCGKLPSIKFIDIPMAVARQYKKPPEENDAFYITEEDIKKIKIVKAEEGDG